MRLRHPMPSSRSARTGRISRILGTGALPCAALIAACSSSGSGTASTGTASTTSAAASTGTGTTSSTGSGAGGAGGAGGAMGTGCAACVTVAALPMGSQPYGLFVDTTHVYWTNFGTGEVMQANLDGSSLLTLTKGEMAPVAVQALGGFVYWVSYSETGVARRAPVGGGVVENLAPAPAARELVVSQDSLWWTGEPDDVWKAPSAGLPDGGAPELLTGNLLSNGITADATSLYWVNRFDGHVMRSDQALGNATPLATGDVPWDIAVDETHVYWTEQGSTPAGGKVMRASKVDGTGLTTIASEAKGPQGIAVDASRVYWANKLEGTIESAPLAGGAVTVLATGQAQPVNVAVDGSFVYWVSTGGDAIVKIPK
jgi:hypothetical protein